MGTIKNGILGGFSGKVGAVVGASWRGIDYMRGLPRISNKPATKAQLGQQAKLTMLRGFLLAIGGIIDKCYQNYEQFTAMNAALSYNMKNAITGTCPDYVVNFPNLLFSKGDLLGTWSPKAVLAENNALDFSWENSGFSPMCAADDEVTLVVYAPAVFEFSCLAAAALRADAGVRLLLPPKFSGHTVHCYLSFFSKSKKIASTNQYLGAIEIY